MRLKAGKNLTVGGKRKGRRPSYLSEQQLAAPLPAASRELNKGGANPGLHSLRDTIFIIRLMQAKHRHPAASQKQLAYALLETDPASRKTGQELAAVEARIRRVTCEGVDKIPVKRIVKRSISPKTQ